VNPHPRADHTRIIEVGALRVRVRITGQGPALLLLNGLTRPLESWLPTVEALGAHTIVAFDAPGVGGSATPKTPFTIASLAALGCSVLDEAGVDTADVLGFSHGGAVAQQLAFDAPERVGRLVLAATTCGIGATPGIHGPLKSLFPPSEARGWPQPNPVGTLWNLLAITAWSSIPFLAAIRAPTLVVCGTYDRWVPAVNSKLLADRIPGAKLTLLQAGHDLQRDGRAAALVHVVEPFLAAGRVPLRDAG
jgi:pimeloyl-ACP methyl ester carboxylesterase